MVVNVPRSVLRSTVSQPLVQYNTFTHFVLMCCFSIVRTAPRTVVILYIVKLLLDCVNMLTDVLHVSVSWLTFVFLIWHVEVSEFFLRRPRAFAPTPVLHPVRCGLQYGPTFIRSVTQPLAQFKRKSHS